MSKSNNDRNRARRRALRGALALAGAVALMATGALPVAAQGMPAMPKSPVTLNISDPAGDLALTQAAIDEYQRKHPELAREGEHRPRDSARAAGQAQGNAGSRPRRHRPHPHRHRFPGRGHRPGPADEAAPDVLGEISRT